LARHLADSSASQRARESWSSRALKIATKYLEDPEKWAAQDKFGKGLTVCQREVDPGFLVGDHSGKRMVLVSRAVTKLQADLQANGVAATVIASRHERAAALRQPTPAGTGASGGSSGAVGEAAGNDDNGVAGAAAAVKPDGRMNGRWSNPCVKTKLYRQAWKYACTRYKEERAKAQIPGAKSGVDFVGAATICAETRARHSGLGPCAQTIVDAVQSGHASPAKHGPAPNMPQEVSDYLADIVEVFNDLKLPVFRETIINNAKLLITATKYEDAFALEMDPVLDCVKVWDEKKVLPPSV
jgi:hypothetical protein